MESGKIKVEALTLGLRLRLLTLRLTLIDSGYHEDEFNCFVMHKDRNEDKLSFLEFRARRNVK